MQVQVLFFHLYTYSHILNFVCIRDEEKLFFFQSVYETYPNKHMEKLLKLKKAAKMNGSTLNMLVIHLFSWCMQARTTATEIFPTERHPLKRLLTRFRSYLSRHSYGSSSYEKLEWFSPDIQPAFSAVVLAAAQFDSTWSIFHLFRKPNSNNSYVSTLSSTKKTRIPNKKQHMKARIHVWKMEIGKRI